MWAVDYDRAPDYWFPRQCPRAMAWVTPDTTDEDRERIIGPGGGLRVHAVEYGWLERMRTVELYAYRLGAQDFRSFGDPANAHVAETEVVPLSSAHSSARALVLSLGHAFNDAACAAISH